MKIILLAFGLAGLAAAQTNAPVHGTATIQQQRACSVTCALQAKDVTVTVDDVAQIVTQHLVVVNHGKSCIKFPAYIRLPSHRIFKTL
jgi:hypothetical protein